MSKKIQNCVTCYSILEHLLKEFHEAFEKKLLSHICIGLLIIIVYAFMLAWYIEYPIIVGIAFAPLMTYGKSIYMLASAGNWIKLSSKNFSRKVYDLSVSYCNGSRSLTAKLMAFSAKVSNNISTISPCSFFTLDRSFITSAFTGISTYLVILVQFKQSEFSHTNRYNSSAKSAT